jgi:hypothetical protein
MKLGQPAAPFLLSDVGKGCIALTALLATTGAFHLSAEAKQQASKRESPAYCTADVIERCENGRRVECVNKSVGSRCVRRCKPASGKAKC